jgi:hypothetical protein
MQHPSLFGPGAHGLDAGISEQAVCWIVARHQKGEIADNRGRPHSLLNFLVVMIVAAFASYDTLGTRHHCFCTDAAANRDWNHYSTGLRFSLEPRAQAAAWCFLLWT